MTELKMKSWQLDHVPRQEGRVALVTGANSGIGFQVARMLALKGASVIISCRNHAKGECARKRILVEAPCANVSIRIVDLADLESVAKFADGITKDHDRLDLLINNAGVMVPPLSRTSQGFELQLGTNHLGHFALTGRLMPLLQNTRNSRVTVVSSAGANFGQIDLDDLQFDRRPYDKWPAYCQSKLANLMFALELARRLDAAHSSIQVTAAHPGGASTNLQRNAWYLRALVNPFVMKPADGALSTLRAACDIPIRNGSYWGPSHFFEMRGPPTEAYIPKRAKDLVAARRLWELSEKLTGVSFDFAERKAVLDDQQ
jgi:NAD(P)-dependent dehydrogenase (short-subunit alcohol dehydrogenase family)